MTPRERIKAAMQHPELREELFLLLQHAVYERALASVLSERRLNKEEKQ